MRYLAQAYGMLALLCVFVGCQESVPPSASVQPPTAVKAAGPKQASPQNVASGPATARVGATETEHEHHAPVVLPKGQAGGPPRTSGPVALGEKLSGLPLVSVAELVKNPEAHAGKKVRVEGTVVSYCFHARHWFAVRDTGSTEGPAVRLLTGSRFLVPENAMGMKARAEGTVELMDVSASSARHYAESHGLGGSKAVEGGKSVRQVVIRVTGAEFF